MLSVAILGGIYFFLLDYVTLKIILFICFAASIILLVDLVAIFLKKKKKKSSGDFSELQRSN
jgi:predicted membrane metal-binding protein